MTVLNAEELRSRFFRLAVVNVLSNLLVPLAGLADTAFLGHLSDIRHLAGVSLATVLFNYIYWTFGFLRMGTTGTTAQAVGRQDQLAVYATLLRNGLLGIAIGLVILILQEPIRQIGFALLSATPDVEQSGQAYYRALIWGAPATLLNFVLLGWFLGRAEGRRVLVLSMVNNGCNVLLNYWLIVRLGWASAGAGAATACSQYLMLLIGLGFVLQEFPWSKRRLLTAQLWDLSVLTDTLRLNRDILIRTFALLSVFAAFTNISAAIGTLTLTANALLLQILSLAAYFIDGFAFATESLVGILKGQDDYRQMRHLLRLAGGVSFGLGIAIALLFILFPQPLFGILTSHDNVIISVSRYVPWLLPLLGFGSLAYILDGYFLGLTQGPILRRASIVSAVVGFAPLAALAWWLESTPLLWTALTCFMAARVITLGRNVEYRS